MQAGGAGVALGGAQALYGIEPDLTTLGKVIGGGLPIGAYGGRRAIMQLVAPAGPVYQAGTLAGNPLAMAAGLVTLRELARPGVFPGIVANTRTLVEGLSTAAHEAGIPLQTACVGTMFGLFFANAPVTNYAQARQSDSQRFARFFHAMLEEGVYFAPSPFEAGFTSSAHSATVIADTIQAAERAFRLLHS